MASEEAQMTTIPVAHSKYSKRVVLKSILARDDGGIGLVGERFVIGGWVKSSKEVKKETSPSSGTTAVATAAGDTSPKDVSCAEIFQSRLPIFRSILRVLGAGNHPHRENVHSTAPKPPVSSISILQVSDGSCVASLQVLVSSSLASPCSVLPTGTSILAEGVLKQPSVFGKHVIEFHAEKILHVGTVDYEKYPLSKKRLPLIMLRDFPQFRTRTTTVASVMRIRSALNSATQSFFQNHGFLNVQVPIITTTDCEGFSEKFRITPIYRKSIKKEELNINKETEDITLDVLKAAIKEKSKLVEELKRSESNKEALNTAVQDLQKTNELALQLQAKEASKSGTMVKGNKVNLYEELFSKESYLTVSGRLHLDAYACSLGNVYSFGPRFLALKTDSAKHVSEMWMVELGMAFSELGDAINCAEDYVKYLCKSVLENCSEDMMFVSKRIDKNRIECLQILISSSFEKISYTEAINILKKVTDDVIFKVKIEWGIALTEEHVSYLADEIYKKPLFIYNYPKDSKPFHIRINDDKKTVAAFELIIPTVGALIKGSQNEERVNTLQARIEEVGLPREEYEWYLDICRHGTVKHSGFSFGFDLMVLLITGLNDVRDVIPMIP